MAIDIPDYCWWFREKPVETIHHSYWQALGVGANIQICDLPRHDLEVIIAELDSSDTQTYFDIRPYDEANVLGDPLWICHWAGGFIPLPSPLAVYLYTSSSWDLLVYEAITPSYKIALTRPLRFGNGARIRVYNAVGGAINVCVQVGIIDRGVKQ